MSFSLIDKYVRDEGKAFMTGVQALVRLPLEQHRADRAAGRRIATFVSGYPGSPLGGYDLELARNAALLEPHDVVFQPGLNEELAATAVMGSQIAASFDLSSHDGVVGIWYGKGPGLDRATDAIRHANFAGASPTGGAIALVGDDPAAKSSTIPFSSERAMIDLALPVLSPGNVQEALDFGRHAIAMSRASGLWVGLRIATVVADGSATVDVDDGRLSIVEVPHGENGAYQHVPTARLVAPTSMDLEVSLFGSRLEVAGAYARANRLDQVAVSHPGDRLGIIAAGKSWYDLQQALVALDLDDQALARAGIRLLKIGSIHPLDAGLVREFARGLREVVVVEDKRSLLESMVREALYDLAERPVVVGKRDPSGAALLRPTGELDADTIADAVASRLVELGGVPSAEHRLAARRARTERDASPVVVGIRSTEAVALPKRAPYFCSGCPHNTSTHMHEDDLVGAGIGCSGMVMLMPAERVGTLTGVTQMGGEGAQWIGMAPFVRREHMFQNLGDGTFFHSGSLAIRAAVASGATLTYKLLVNSAVAMTGGQDAVGGMAIPEMTRLLELEGVSKTIITTEDPRRYRRAKLASNVEVVHRDRFEEAQRSLAGSTGVTVLLHDQHCAAEARRKRKRGFLPDPPQRIVINERVCEGCGDCGDKANCLSLVPVETEFGRKTQVNQGTCNRDYTCLKGDCPSFLEIVPRKGPDRRVVTPPLDGLFPEPALAPIEGSWVLRIAGMGGTGVVTVAQVLGTAALLDGLTARGLDQTGMAQKGGPVVSDLKLFRGAAAGTSRAAAEEVDTYLGADLLVAGDADLLRTCAAGRTTAIVSTAAVPTGAMVANPDVVAPDLDVARARVDAATTPARNVYLDAAHVATTLFGGDQYANVILLGAAHQAGAIPLAAASIEQAITLNGVAVDGNIQAFRRGRQAVADPAGLQVALAGVAPPITTTGPRRRTVPHDLDVQPGGELATIVERRIGELLDYQGVRLVERYLDLVGEVQRAERAAGLDGDELTTAVATWFFKLLAYKDEYEVARLSLLSEVDADIKRQFGADAKVKHLLHPPVLRSLGIRRKLRLGRTARPAFLALRAMRRVRGTPFDLFGLAEVRRVERRLITEYEQVIRSLLPALTPRNTGVAVEIAALPDVVRGYESLKLANVERYRDRLRTLLDRYAGQQQAMTAS